MLPEINGYELMEYIRPLEIPVIFLTAKGDVKDRVKGLKLGAEDYIVKPFEIIELVARVETVLRRYHKTSTVLSVYDISVDTLSRVVKKNDQVINLTVKEYDLLLLFIQNKNIAFSVIEFMKRYGVIIIWEIAELLIFMYSECEKSLDWKIKLYQFTKLVIVWREIDEFFWKLYFSIMAITLICFSVGGYMLIQTSFDNSFEREVEGVYQENDILVNSLTLELLPHLEELTIKGGTFQERLDLLKNLVSNMTVETFNGNVSFCIRAENGDVVYQNDTFNDDHKLFDKISQNERGYIVQKDKEHYKLQSLRIFSLNGTKLYFENARDISELF